MDRRKSVALAFQIRALSKTRLRNRIRALAEDLDALELATDEALGRSEP